MPEPPAGVGAGGASPRTRIGVVGVGHLGRHHARLLAENPLAELCGFADPNAQNRGAAAEAHVVPAFSDYRELLGSVEAVSIAVPTAFHLEVGRFFLERGVDVLVEKPIAPTVAEGRALVAA